MKVKDIINLPLWILIYWLIMGAFAIKDIFFNGPFDNSISILLFVSFFVIWPLVTWLPKSFKELLLMIKSKYQSKNIYTDNGSEQRLLSWLEGQMNISFIITCLLTLGIFIFILAEPTVRSLWVLPGVTLLIWLAYGMRQKKPWAFTVMFYYFSISIIIEFNNSAFNPVGYAFAIILAFFYTNSAMVSHEYEELKLKKNFNHKNEN